MTTEKTGSEETTSGDVRGDQPPPDSEAKQKKTVRRKPLWLALPVEYGDVVGEDGEIVSAPTRYELYECNGKDEVQKVLKKLNFDATNVRTKDVKLFRADPIPLTLNVQTTIKF